MPIVGGKGQGTVEVGERHEQLQLCLGLLGKKPIISEMILKIIYF